MERYEIDPENIPSDLEPDEKITLWRYMSFGSLCEILMNNHIPLISIRNFSDKSEGVILKEVLSKLPNTYEESIEYAIQKYLNGYIYPHGINLKMKMLPCGIDTHTAVKVLL